MERDSAWLFLDAGRRLERAQSLVRLVRSVLVNQRVGVVEIGRRRHDGRSAAHPPAARAAPATQGAGQASSSSCPAIAGKGDHPKGGGRGAGGDVISMMQGRVLSMSSMNHFMLRMVQSCLLS